MKCNLCNAESTLILTGQYGEYSSCSQCRGISLAPEYFPTAQAERKTYETHQNDVKDVRYQKFVSPIVEKITASFFPWHHGLDFGCGTGPVIQYVLQQIGYAIDLYDPFFYNDQSIFSNTYDFIACCEVIEHFHRPLKDFSLLYSLLKPGGRLYCMTEVFNDHIDFKEWYYKNDPTHVFFYHPVTFKFIQENIGFSTYEMKNRLIVFKRK
jgi:SAM-dependent methyltransferase